jgi:outer membrane protein OmpA-like peptidoglycan-associated protein
MANRKVWLVLLLSMFGCSGCAHTSISTRTMEFEPGMQALAGNLADQLEQSNIGNLLNKVVVNKLTNNKQLKRIVVDPFIDAESGYPVKINSKIRDVVSAEIDKRFKITGAMEPDNLEVSEYVLNGTVSLEGGGENREKEYRVNASVFEKASGKVLASASVRIDRFDTTPMDIYKDSPVYLKGKNYEEYMSSARKSTSESVSSEYRDRLRIKSMLVKGDALYEHKEFKESLSYYNQAAAGESTPQLEILNGQFTNLVKQGQWEEVEAVYGKLIRVSIAETSEIASKITFGPNSKAPIGNKSGQYNIYAKEIAKFVASVPGCKVKIIGHCSRTGKEAYNDKLSLQRAQWIQKQMASFAPEVMAKSETFGRGYQENIVGSGRDDITDEIDRRVEFKFQQCVAE